MERKNKKGKDLSMYKIVIRTIIVFMSVALLLVGLPASTFAASKSIVPPQQTNVNSYEYYTPSLSNNGNPGWAYFTDTNGHASAYTDSNRSTFTSQAVWNFPIKGSCDYYVYVPYQNATATVAYGFFRYGVKVGSYLLPQLPARGFTYIGSWSVINQVQFSNNDGESGTKIGVGAANSLEIAC